MNLVPFDQGVPAHLQGRNKVANKLAAFAREGFGSISLKGKVFHLVRGDERVLVTKPGSDGEPAAALEMVIVAVNPGKARVYYTSGYTEGSDDKPTCYSNDGVTPAADAQTPQHKKCALCPHSQWGSRINENGKPSRACAESARLAVASPGRLSEPLLLRVPTMSLKTLGAYGGDLAARGVDVTEVVTRIGFDYSVAYPALTFKPVAFVSPEMKAEITEAAESELVAQILGTTVAPLSESDAVAPVDQSPEPAPAVEAAEEKPAAKAAAKPAAKPAAKARAAVEGLAAAEEAPKAKVKVEEAPAKSDDIEVADDLADGLDSLLGSLQLDD